jgi:hypothetical protein
MMHCVLPLLAALVALGIAVPDVAAQVVVPKQPVPKIEIPRSLRPPPGMCRVWVDNVPAQQQPAPTDCASAIRNRPPNGRVIFSDENARGSTPKGKEKSEKKPPKKPAESSERG